MCRHWATVGAGAGVEAGLTPTSDPAGIGFAWIDLYLLDRFILTLYTLLLSLSPADNDPTE